MFQRLLVSVALVALSFNVASAQETEDLEHDFDPKLEASYFWDGGVVPFLYAPLTVAAGLRLFVTPPSQPRLFVEGEGGAMTFEDTVPSYAVGVLAGLGAGLLALVPSQARLYHFKGYGEAVLTTIVLTEITKNTFGRHRPNYQEGDTDADQRRSFFSGHSSITAVSTVYLGLYFQNHVAPRLRGSRALYSVLTYSALGAAMVGVPLSRVVDNRHHLSDVLTGGLVGSALAGIFYAYQESRYQRDREDFYRGKRSQVLLVPDLQNRGVALLATW